MGQFTEHCASHEKSQLKVGNVLVKALKVVEGSHIVLLLDISVSVTPLS